MRKGVEFLLATLGNGEAKRNLSRFNVNAKEGSFQHTDLRLILALVWHGHACRARPKPWRRRGRIQRKNLYAGPASRILGRARNDNRAGNMKITDETD